MRALWPTCSEIACGWLVAVNSKVELGVLDISDLIFGLFKSFVKKLSVGSHFQGI